MKVRHGIVECNLLLHSTLKLPNTISFYASTILLLGSLLCTTIQYYFSCHIYEIKTCLCLFTPVILADALNRTTTLACLH